MTYNVFGGTLNLAQSVSQALDRPLLLVLRWATVSGFNSWCRTFISVCNQPATQGQLSLPSLRGRQMSTSFGWEGKGRYGLFR